MSQLSNHKGKPPEAGKPQVVDKLHVAKTCFSVEANKQINTEPVVMNNSK